MQASITTQTLSNNTGLTPGPYRCQAHRDGALVATISSPDPGPFTFTAAVPGSYVATVQRMSTTNVGLGPAVSSDPLVVDPTDCEAPLTVTLSL